LRKVSEKGSQETAEQKIVIELCNHYFENCGIVLLF